MELARKLEVLSDAAKYDASCASSGSRRSALPGGLGNSDGTGICHSYTPDGRCVSLLKILLTNYCVYDCLYCVNRVSSDIARARFSIDEVVSLTLDFYKRNLIEGLFLSSGIIQDADYTMNQLVTVARTLRTTHRFGGYIHLKTIPGASATLLEEAGAWADRLSVNIELPTETALERLAPQKTHAVIEATMEVVAARERESKEETRTRGGRVSSPGRSSVARFAPAGQSTQMIVGAAPESDEQVLAKASRLYSGQGLRRVYYSAFSPFPRADGRLPIKAPPLVREHRLYEADWLMRFYGFKAGELAFEPSGNLDLSIDPKLAWALKHRDLFPVDVNRAPREQLLRVPGFGVRTVDRLLRVRRHHKIRLDDLQSLHVALRRAKPFVILADANPNLRLLDQILLRDHLRPPPQMSLFAPRPESNVGDLVERHGRRDAAEEGRDIESMDGPSRAVDEVSRPEWSAVTSAASRSAHSGEL